MLQLRWYCHTSPVFVANLQFSNISVMINTRILARVKHVT